MFIRRTRTNNTALKESYFTYRLVRGERIGGKVRQITALNLGRNFSIKQEDWPANAQRIGRADRCRFCDNVAYVAVSRIGCADAPS